jgi:hypothetical protein
VRNINPLTPSKKDIPWDALSLYTLSRFREDESERLVKIRSLVSFCYNRESDGWSEEVWLRLGPKFDEFEVKYSIRFIVVQWLIVSVIVITCALLAIRSLVRSIWRGFDPRRDVSESRSPCGSCGGCKNGQAGQVVQIVKLDTRIPKGASLSNEETHPMSGQYR